MVGRQVSDLEVGVRVLADAQNFKHKGDDLMSEIVTEIRQLNYRDLVDIYKGEHYKVFEAQLMNKVLQDTNDKKARMIYIALNFPRLIAEKFADLMFLNPLKIDNNLDNLALFEEFIQENLLHSLNWRLAVYAAVRGDGVYRLGVKENRVIVNYTDPGMWFPELEGGEIARHIFQWIVEFENKKYIRREIYERGLVRNELYRIKDENVELITDENKDDVLGDQVDISEFYEGLREEVKTGVDSFLVYHFKNNNSEDRFGRSEFIDLLPLFDELNNRITQISKILDVHAAPEKFYPDSYFQMDEQYYSIFKKVKYMFKKSDDGVYQIPQEAKEKPFALTWDAKLEACFNEMQFILDTMLSLAEVAPHLIYMKKMAETEESVKLQMTNTISKVNRKRMNYEPVLLQLFEDFQSMVYNNEVIKSSYGELVVAGEPEPVSFDWGEPIPTSEKERLENLDRKVRMEAVSDRRKIAEANPELTDEQVEEELRQIQQGYSQIG
jgi:hypothetical protein